MDTTLDPDITYYATTAYDDIPEGLYLAYSIVAIVNVTFVMFAMGCGLTLEALKPHVKRPIGPLIGLTCQFVLMPLLCFAGAHAFQMEPHLAIGLVVVGSCPGGATSNMFTYWCRGDLSLSVAMTACSTVLALFFMPFNTFIYTKSWTDEATVIPYKNMAIAIVLTWIPVGLGIAVRNRNEKFADKFIRVGSIIGFALYCLLGVIQRLAYPEVFQLPWTIWFAAVIMPLVGMALGFGLARLCRFPLFQCRTVAFETGMQNVGIALALIALSFPTEEASKNSQFPLLYGALAITDATVISVFHRTYFRTKGKRTWCHQCYYKSIEKKQRQDSENKLNEDDVVVADNKTYGPSYDVSSVSYVTLDMDEKSKPEEKKDKNGDSDVRNGKTVF